MSGSASRANGSKKSPTVGNRLKQHYIYRVISSQRSRPSPPSEWDLGPPTKKPPWFTSGYLGTLSFGIGRRGNKEHGDFIILCIRLEVFHTFRFLTNLRPNRMTPELMRLSPRVPAPPRSSKSSSTAPIFLCVLPLSLTFGDNGQTRTLRNPTSLTRSVYPAAHISLRVHQAL